MAREVDKPDAEWRRQLSDLQYRVAREKGTERAFTGEYHDSKVPGIYHCACCGEALFDSDAKYDSGSGWPGCTRTAKCWPKMMRARMNADRCAACKCGSIRAN